MSGTIPTVKFFSCSRIRLDDLGVLATGSADVIPAEDIDPLLEWVVTCPEHKQQISELQECGILGEAWINILGSEYNVENSIFTLRDVSLAPVTCKLQFVAYIAVSLLRIAVRAGSKLPVWKSIEEFLKKHNCADESTIATATLVALYADFERNRTGEVFLPCLTSALSWLASTARMPLRVESRKFGDLASAAMLNCTKVFHLEVAQGASPDAAARACVRRYNDDIGSIGEHLARSELSINTIPPCDSKVLKIRSKDPPNGWNSSKTFDGMPHLFSALKIDPSAIRKVDTSGKSMQEEVAGCSFQLLSTCAKLSNQTASALSAQSHLHGTRLPFCLDMTMQAEHIIKTCMESSLENDIDVAVCMWAHSALLAVQQRVQVIMLALKRNFLTIYDIPSKTTPPISSVARRAWLMAERWAEAIPPLPAKPELDNFFILAKEEGASGALTDCIIVRNEGKLPNDFHKAEALEDSVEEPVRKRARRDTPAARQAVESDNEDDSFQTAAPTIIANTLVSGAAMPTPDKAENESFEERLKMLILSGGDPTQQIIKRRFG